MTQYDTVFLAVAVGLFLTRPWRWWLASLAPAVALIAHSIPLGRFATPVAALVACLLVPRYAPVALVLAIPVYETSGNQQPWRPRILVFPVCYVRPDWIAGNLNTGIGPKSLTRCRKRDTNQFRRTRELPRRTARHRILIHQRDMDPGLHRRPKKRQTKTTSQTDNRRHILRSDKFRSPVDIAILIFPIIPHAK